MKWTNWSISKGPGDFLPIIIGGLIMLMTVPPFVMVLWVPDRNSGIIGTPLLVILGIGAVIGAAFIVLGIRLCSYPGSLLYQLSHGRVFWK
ncbi:MAG TPA: hypothetical protein VHY35_05645 [Stellaceae bacterium]|jgi:hypothetical protein|nr:hypothetical protein [Stellaceae bacterium]